MRVAVVCEPRLRDGDASRASRQRLAARDAGAELHVLAAPAPFLARRHGRARPWSTAWAAASLALALRRLGGNGFDLIHAQDATAGAVARRALRVLPGTGAPLVVSVDGEDVLRATRSHGAGAEDLARTLRAATLTLASSSGIAALASAQGARATHVVHPGADLPQRPSAVRLELPTLVTVGELLPRKRHADVVRALAVLSDRHPTLRYTIVGDGPERAALEALALRLGVVERVQLLGRLEPRLAIERARTGTLFVMPSTEEAFGLAYIEAMAAGVPALGCRGEPGPEEIAAAGAGFVLVPPGDIERLSQRIDELLSDRERLLAEGRHARETVAACFTWEQCGRETVSAYEEALRRAARRWRPAACA